MKLRAFIIFSTILYATQNYASISKDSTYTYQDTIKLEEVSTTANYNKRKISGMLSGNINLDVKEINNIPSLTGTIDVLKVMELTPSVRTSGDGSSNMYVRGGDAGQNIVTYNKITSYSPGHILGIFPLFNAEHLSSAKLIKNGADTEAGNFISSAIEIESKKNIPQKNTVKGNIGLLASQASLDLKLNDNWGAYISGRKTYLELIVNPLINKITNDSGNNSEMNYGFWDTNVTIVGNINKKHRLLYDFMYSNDKLNIKDDDAIINGKLVWKNLLSSISLESNINENLYVTQSISTSQYDHKLHTFQGDMNIYLKSKMEDYSYKNKFNLFINDIPVSFGLNYTYHQTKPHDLSLINSDIVTNSIKEDILLAHDISIFLGSQYSINNFTLKGIIRYNLFNAKAKKDNSFKTFNSIDIRLSAQYKLKENIFLSLNYNHNNQYINKLTPSSIGLPTDFWIIANKELKPQKGDEISLGYYHIFNNSNIELSADLYYREMQDVTQFDYNFIENDNISFIDKISYGSGRSFGLELMLKKNFGKFTGWLGYTLSKSDRKFDNINNGKRFKARYDRTHDFTITSNYKINDKWDISLTGIYATGNRYTQPTSWYFINNLPIKEYTEYNNAKLPDYKRLDIGLNYWFRKNNGLNFSIYNVFANNNPIYVFLDIKQDTEANANSTVKLRIKKKQLYTLIPSISWNFKF